MTWLTNQNILKSSINDGKHLAITTNANTYNPASGRGHKFEQRLFLWNRGQNDTYSTGEDVTAVIKSSSDATVATLNYKTGGSYGTVLAAINQNNGCYKFNLSSTGQMATTSELIKLLPFKNQPTNYCDGLTLK